MKTRLFAAIALAVACMAASPAVDLIDKTTVTTVAQDHKLAADLLGMGPKAVADVCAQVIPLGTGDDTHARMAVASMVRNAGAPGQPDRREMLARVFDDFITRSTDPEVRAFFIYQLRFVGGDESVDTLVPLLADKTDRLAPAAIDALIAIHTRRSAEAIATALESPTNANLVALLDAAGTLRVKGADEQILKYLDHKDNTIRYAAMFAAAQIGIPNAATALARAADDGALAQYDRSRAVSYYLDYAWRRAQLGSREEAVAICTNLLKSDQSGFRCSALSMLVTVERDKAMPELLAAFASPDKQFRNAALLLAERIPGADHTGSFIHVFPSLRPEAQADLIAMLGRRGDASALPVVTEALSSASEPVRRAAIASVPDLAGNQTTAVLLKSLATAQPNDIRPTVDTLSRVHGNAMLAASAARMPQLPPPAQEALLDMLARRGARAQSPAVMALAASDNAGVRIAALKAMTHLAVASDTQPLIDRALAAASTAEQAAALRAAIAAAGHITPADNRADGFVVALAKTSGDRHAGFLRALARLGGPRALAAVSADLKSADAGSQNAALRALAEWTDDAAVPELLNQAKTRQDLTQSVVALRGAVNLVKGSGQNAEQKVKQYEQMFSLSRRPDEKKLILGALSSERTMSALKLAAAQLDDPALKPEASLAACTIAVPSRRGPALKGPEVIEILQKAAPSCPNQELRQRVEQLLAATLKNKSEK